MKMLLKKLTLVLGVVALSTSAFGQKKEITNAALEYKKLKPMLYAGTDIPGAKKSVIVAKGFIDKAAEHPDTKENQKMFWYKGEIYFALSMLIELDSTIIDMSSDDALDASLKAWEMGMNAGKKYKIDIEAAANEKRNMAYMVANEAWKQEMYAEAGEAYEVCGLLSNSIGILDTMMIYNAGLSYENAKNYEKAAEMYSQLAESGYRGSKGAVLAAGAYKALGDNDKVIEILTKARMTYPSDRELLLGLVNAFIDSGNDEGAEKALSDAILADPGNAKLHYNSGTIYINLGDKAKKAEEAEKANEAYAKAETALNKALEIDPNYVDAQYQLGAHLYNWANELMLEANFLKIGDPNMDKLTKLSEEKMDAAIVALEKYIEHAPTDAGIIQTLWKAYHKKGNEEKAAEYKAKLDALK